MPTHLYLRLGMFDEAEEGKSLVDTRPFALDGDIQDVWLIYSFIHPGNLASMDARTSYVLITGGDLVQDQTYHSYEFLHYVYLNQGRQVQSLISISLSVSINMFLFFVISIDIFTDRSIYLSPQISKRPSTSGIVEESAADGPLLPDSICFSLCETTSGNRSIWV